jgi:predicted Zn-dependent protease
VSGELELAERALRHATGDAQVTVTAERSLHARFARSAPTQATSIDDRTVHVLAVRGGWTGSATTNATGDEALRDAVRAAEAAARAAAAAGPAGAGEHPGLPAPTPTAGERVASLARSESEATRPAWDGATAALDPGVAGAAIAAAVAVAAEHGGEAFGLWTAGEVRTAIASTAGIRVSEATTDAFLKAVVRDADGRSGYATDAAVAAGAIDPAATARRAARHLPRGPLAEVAPGELPVVLGPEAVALLLEFLGLLAFNGLAHAEGRGALAGRLGEAVAAPAVTIADRPADPRTLPRAFDADGVPKAPITLVERGVARAVVHDARSAIRAGDGARSTGHALAPGGAPIGPLPLHLVLEGGDAADEAALVAPIERGLYVNRLWYVNAVHERSALLTGVTRDGTFLIEDGALTRPARDVRFTDSALGVLERTEALTAAPRLVGEAEFYGRRSPTGVVCPALRASALRISGGA